MYLTLIDFLERGVDQAEFASFDGDAMVAVHRDLIKAIDAGAGPHLDAAIAAHKPTADHTRLSIKRMPQR
jgi:hypothetical protein